MISIKIRINAFILDLFSSEILSGSVTVNRKGLLFSVIFYNVDRPLSYRGHRTVPCLIYSSALLRLHANRPLTYLRNFKKLFFETNYGNFMLVQTALKFTSSLFSTHPLYFSIWLLK